MMKSLLSIAQLLVTVAGVIVAAQTAWAEATVSFPTTSGGSGTSDDPYKISSTDDLDQLAADVNSGIKAVVKCQRRLLGRSIIAINPPLVFFIFAVLQRCENFSALHSFRHKGVCKICERNGHYKDKIKQEDEGYDNLYKRGCFKMTHPLLTINSTNSII